MSPKDQLRSSLKSEWCAGRCSGNWLPTTQELLGGVTSINSSGQPVLHVAVDGGSIGGGLVPEQFSAVTATYPDSTTEVYTYALVGGGTATVTVTYTDATKAELVSAVRS